MMKKIFKTKLINDSVDSSSREAFLTANYYISIYNLDLLSLALNDFKLRRLRTDLEVENTLQLKKKLGCR